MTVINGIEIDDIDYKVNEIKYAIFTNKSSQIKIRVGEVCDLWVFNY